jgi:YqaJ-like viral recombinase domain
MIRLSHDTKTKLQCTLLPLVVILLFLVQPSQEFAAVSSSSSSSHSNKSAPAPGDVADTDTVIDTVTTSVVTGLDNVKKTSFKANNNIKRNRRGISKNVLLQEQIRLLLSLDDDRQGNTNKTMTSNNNKKGEEKDSPCSLQQQQQQQQKQQSLFSSSEQRMKNNHRVVSRTLINKKITTTKRVVAAPENEITQKDIASVTIQPDTTVSIQLVNGTDWTVQSHLLHQRYQTEVWLAVRAAVDVTASEFSALLGTSYFTTRQELLDQKVGRKSAFSGNAACTWGLKVEPLAFQQYIQVTKNMVQETGLHLHRIDDDDDDNDNDEKEADNCDEGRQRRRSLVVGASPDGLVMERRVSTNNNKIDKETTTIEAEQPQEQEQQQGLLEIKCLYGQRMKRSIRQYEYCPRRYYDQIQGQLAICDKPWCDLMIWIPKNSKGGKNYSILRVPRNETHWTTVLRPAIVEFCRDVETERAVLRAGGG